MTRTQGSVYMESSRQIDDLYPDYQALRVTGGSGFNVDGQQESNRRTVDHCPADIVLAPSVCSLTDLEYADDAVMSAESSTKLQHGDTDYVYFLMNARCGSLLNPRPGSESTDNPLNL
ncbi:hypothetical protein RB195_009135 [Necator americanus]